MPTRTEPLEAYVACNSTDCVEIRVRVTGSTPAKTQPPAVKIRRIINGAPSSSSSSSDDRNDDDGGEEGGDDVYSFDVRRSTSDGTFWRCTLADPPPPAGAEFVAGVSLGGGAATDEGSSPSSATETKTTTTEVLLQFRTLDAANLGRHRLRLGILSDPHVNRHRRRCDGKRLYRSANYLLEKYSRKLAADHNVDRIVLPGDVCDSGSDAELKVAAEILGRVRRECQVPVHAVIGNHERDPRKFAKLLVPESREKGYYSVDDRGAGVHMILLATDHQGSLDEGTEQLDWLRRDLKTASAEVDVILVFMHYSLILHPLHNGGRWDDGLQVLDNARAVLGLLHRYRHAVRAVVCGHKNVPSAVVDNRGLLHTLSPQLIQVPCGYDVVDIYDNGLIRATHEIEEVELQDISRRSAGELDSQRRWGRAEHRSLRHDWKRP